MKDTLGIFGHPEEGNTGEYNVDELRAALNRNGTAPPPPKVQPRQSATRERRAKRVADQRRRQRRVKSSMIALVVLLVIAAGTFVLVRTWSNQEEPPPADFAGAGTTETIVRINQNDGLTQIGTALLTASVVASVDAFVQTGQGNADLAAIQPGYYKVREGASAASAISDLLTATNRVGVVDLIPGITLADVTLASGEIKPGYVSQLTAAACVPLNGVSNCFSTDDLWNVLRTGDVAALGLVEWAVPRVTASTDPDRRLEGMIAPGTYNVPPGNDPTAVLTAMLGASAVYWNASEIGTKAAAQGHDPYDLAVIASLIEREAITSDMANVSRVIENRLAIPMILQLDSTVNYAKAESQIATAESDRADTTNPYNTYVREGLPPTPIGGIGPAALDAALHPADGPWLYFVKIDPVSGKSCFSTTLEEHNRCVATAQANGVFG